MITKEKILEIEHGLLRDQELCGVAESNAYATLQYLLGVTDMAEEICDAIKRDEST